MKLIRIKPVSENGINAIEQHFKESVLLSSKDKRKFFFLGIETVRMNNPLVFEIRIKQTPINRVLQPNVFTEMVHSIMQQNGAERTDYTLEVE
jgi:hypothetical protein